MSMKQDALRYRWLRDTQGASFRDPLNEESDDSGEGSIDCIFVGSGYGTASALDGNELDEAIDLAIEKYGWKDK